MKHIVQQIHFVGIGGVGNGGVCEAVVAMGEQGYWYRFADRGWTKRHK